MWRSATTVNIADATVNVSGIFFFILLLLFVDNYLIYAIVVLLYRERIINGLCFLFDIFVNYCKYISWEKYLNNNNNCNSEKSIGNQPRFTTGSSPFTIK
ncbi:hypothetical protein KQX54_001022 [Cotesia glomerata]|uniref:Uncharacterized protein n=1 Tax=Cotesia glomerata TaxID=32391 RepID=A0AAV7HVU2_COTGL|nr:hypothetical protein KQX54_001022 [Cotesia glomerata]